MASNALRRVTDLFIEGTEMVLDEEDPVLIWINKLNPFQVDEARKDGQAARTGLMLAMSNPLSEESQLFDVQGTRLTDETIARAMAQTKYNQFLVEVADDMHSDEDWSEKSNAMERSEEQVADLPEDHPDRAALATLTEEWFGEMTTRIEGKREQEFTDLRALSHDELRAKYRDSWIEDQATNAFYTQYRITEIWYSMRECFSKGRGDNGRWEHGKCDHRIKLVDERKDVTQLPDGLIKDVREAIANLTVKERAAKGSPAALPVTTIAARRKSSQDEKSADGTDAPLVRS